MFDKDKLELMYFLTRQQKLMNHAEAARVYGKIKGISERTVRRWFKALQKNQFDYFLAPNYDSLGLVPVYVVLENLSNYDFFKIHNYLYYIFSGTDFSSLKRVLIVGYLIPQNKLICFKEFMERARKLGIFDSYHIMPVQRGVFGAHTPLHSVFSGNGEIAFSEDYDVSYYINLLEHNLKKNYSRSELIARNPLVIPVLFEYLREHWSSRKVWFNAKSKLGQNIWNYVKSTSKRRTRKDSVGIKLVQETIGEINKNADNFFLQTRIDYLPFHNKSVILFMLLKLKNQTTIHSFLESLAKSSVMSRFLIGRNNSGKLGVYLITNLDKMNFIMSRLLPENCNPNFKTRVVLLDMDEYRSYYSKARHYMKFDYSKVFDPKTCSWRYEHEKYMAELQKLAGKA